MNKPHTNFQSFVTFNLYIIDTIFIEIFRVVVMVQKYFCNIVDIYHVF